MSHHTAGLDHPVNINKHCKGHSTWKISALGAFTKEKQIKIARKGWKEGRMEGKKDERTEGWKEGWQEGRKKIHQVQQD